MRIGIFFLLAAPFLLAGCNNDLSDAEKLARDEQLILDYLEANNLDAQRAENGLYYQIDFPGSGSNPTREQFVEIRYVGYFLDNSIFDQTDDDEDPLILPLGSLPSGLVTGIGDYLRPGGRGTFYLPGALGNGSDVLIFEVDLLGVYDTQAEVDEQRILNYLERNEIEATRDPSGVYYVIEEPGSGRAPTLEDRIEVRYKGYLLSDAIFDETPSQSTATLTLGNLILGWQEGLPLFEVGGKGKLFIPSALGYGENPPLNSIIPPNAVLAFDIELVDIVE